MNRVGFALISPLTIVSDSKYMDKVKYLSLDLRTTLIRWVQNQDSLVMGKMSDPVEGSIFVGKNVIGLGKCEILDIIPAEVVYGVFKSKPSEGFYSTSFEELVAARDNR